MFNTAADLSQQPSLFTTASLQPATPKTQMRRLSAHPLFGAMTDSGPCSPRVLENGHSTNVPVSSTPSEPLVDQMHSIQKSMDEMRKAHAEHERHLQEFIQEELKRLQAALTSEVQAAKAEVQAAKAEYLGVNEGIQKGLEKSENRLATILREVNAKASLHNSSTDGRLDVSLQKPSAAAGEPACDSVDDGQDKQNCMLNGQTAKPILRSQTSAQWEEFQEAVHDFDPNCVYKSVLEAKLSQEGFWHRIFRICGMENMLHTKMPEGVLPRVTEHWIFLSCQTMLILSNTVLMGYETDASIKAALKVPQEDPPAWLDTCNLVFNLSFAAELLFRTVALRSWFWVSPDDWGWNFFDVFLVTFSLVSDMISGVNISFIRTLRILRAVRVARIIRVLRFFRQLRQMLFSIMACLSSLAWAFVFLSMIMFMFSVLFLQGTVNTINEMDLSTDLTNPVRLHIETWFSSLAETMLSLLATVTGGADWLDVYRTLRSSGVFYSTAYVLYMLFVTTGVMNVLTGVFLSSADEFMDLDLIVQNEKVRIENFCEQMLNIFKELDPQGTGVFDWRQFQLALKRDDVRAYLASLDLEPTHIHLLFELLDEDKSGVIKLDEFVMGMVRLKGEAKSIDARIIQREIGMLPKMLKDQMGKIHQRLSQR